MSHASVIVALSEADMQGAKDLNEAIQFQMAPFDEQGEWGGEGTRWDWWMIGGRYSGRFAPPDYDPQEDPRNFEPCWVCNASGLRTDKLGNDHRAKDPTYKCNGCQGTGKHLKSSGYWVDVGNVCKRSDLVEEQLAAGKKIKAQHYWNDYQKAKAENDPFLGSFGIKDDDTLESVTKRYESQLVHAYAFLKDRRWCEMARLGMFGMRIASECTIKAEEKGIDYKGRCIYKGEETNSQIVTWEEDDEAWYQLYYVRFIRNLPPETTLVCVDYHV